MKTFPYVVGVAGDFGAGKDEVAKVLVRELGFSRMGFGDSVKDEASEYLTGRQMPGDFTSEIRCLIAAHAGDGLAPYRKPTSPDMRRILQYLGTDYWRAIDPSHWVDLLHARWCELGERSRLVVPDVRFPNELAWVQAQGGVVWKVVRTGQGYEYQDKGLLRHVSERSLAGARFDACLQNSGSLDDLTATVLQAWSQVPLVESA